MAPDLLLSLAYYPDSLIKQEGRHAFEAKGSWKCSRIRRPPLPRRTGLGPVRLGSDCFSPMQLA